MNKKILYVDDEPEFIQPQVEMLMDCGFSVTVLENPDDALNELERANYDLIILDLLMPPSNSEKVDSERYADLIDVGVQLYKAIRDEKKITDTPILVISVVRDSNIIKEIQQTERKYSNRIHFLTKPALSSDVFNEVQKILTAREGREDNT